MPSNPALAGTASLADLRGAIAKVASGKSLTQDEAAEAFELIMSGSATPAQIGGLLMALRMRGETVEEIAGAVLDVFDGAGRRARQMTLPAGRRVVGVGRGVIYVVVRDADDLETLEKVSLR